MAEIPRELNAPLNVRAVPLNVGQTKASSIAVVRNLDLISRLPHGTRFKLQREAMVSGRDPFRECESGESDCDHHEEEDDTHGHTRGTVALTGQGAIHVHRAFLSSRTPV